MPFDIGSGKVHFIVQCNRFLVMGQPTEGLYSPEFERDSCGFGLIANIDDKASHRLVNRSIGALRRLTHRGAVAADGKTGDGCGLLL